MRWLAYISLLFSSSIALAQEPIAVHLNNGVDTSDSNVREVYNLWCSYLNSRPDSVYNNACWSAAEKDRYPICDLLAKDLYQSSDMIRYYRPTVLSIETLGPELYRVRTVFAAPVEQGYSSVLAIANVMAHRENGSFKLFNALGYNTRNWIQERVGHITYHYPPGHHFDLQTANEMTAFTDSLRGLHSFEPLEVDYYICETTDHIRQVQGLDYYMGMGLANQTGGFADKHNRIIFSGNGTEWYPHEMVHVYLHPHYPNVHWWFNEGYATYLGGSRNKSLQWHIDRANKFLAQHPEIDLNEPLAYRNMDQHTGYHYVLGGLLVKMAIEQQGQAGLIRLLSSGGTSNDFYSTIEAVFGIKRNRLNKFLRKSIEQYATAN